MIDRARGLAMARVVGALVVGAMAWPLVAPAYDRAVTATAIALLQCRPSTAEVRARHEGEWTIVESTPDLAPQRLELRTHHNGVPFLAVLMAFASALPWPKRLRRLAVALVILAVTHVGQFVLYVHADRAILNERPYRVTDLRLVNAGWLERLRDPVERRKEVVVAAYEFQAHVGHLLIPALLWLTLAAPFGRTGPMDDRELASDAGGTA